ncbi:MAG: KTSC domain-containing protein [Variovorax sp.]
MKKTFTEPQPYTDAEYVAIPMTPVESNQVGAVGYDAPRRTLAVTFARGAGAVYHYPDVEPEVHVAFMAAESKGKYFGEHIKQLPFQKFRAPVIA